MENNIGNILVKEGLLDNEKLLELLEEQKKQSVKIGQMLISKGIITEDKLMSVIARQYNYKYMSKLDFDRLLFLFFQKL